MSGLDIRQVPVLNDNYVYLIHDVQSGKTACVDPAVAGPVIDAANKLGWTISHILVTHPHYDHTDGIPEIVEAFGSVVYGNRHDFGQIPKCDHGVLDGDLIELGGTTARVMEVPGHTKNHLAYSFDAENAVFVGDTLFSLGCGRLFGGSATQMWNSLKKLRDLPTQTQVYCAHEYTNANADFALSIDPDNADLQARADEVIRLREQGRSTVPSTLEQEVRTNPFLRCDIPAFKTMLGMADREAEEVFAEIRSRKDRF
ncbi:hydroxyacylglutathione hydrolase [Magnetovibrio sp.]|uniref:hydroxyacylglutathione hydrolase n=1 Tax=Magnetovibrio sp. TaxID=2024836 RepID=UPI002F957DCF